MDLGFSLVSGSGLVVRYYETSQLLPVVATGYSMVNETEINKITVVLKWLMTNSTADGG